MRLITLLLLAGSLIYAQPGCYSYYVYFQDDPTLYACYSDGFMFDGPFRGNGPVRIVSSTPGRDNDPWFYSLTLSSDYYLYGWEATQVSTPQWEDLWIEPFELMEQGSPWFNLGTDPLPFGSDQVDWQSVRDIAISSGLYLTSVPLQTRILIGNDQIHILEQPDGTPETYDLLTLTEPVVWIENNPGNKIYIKGYPGEALETSLMIGCNGDLLLAGDLLYSETSPGMLGLVSSHGYGLIADDPGYQSDWPAPFDIETDKDVIFCSSILLPEGYFQAESYWQPVPKVNFTLYGGIQMLQEGPTCTAGSGFEAIFQYDDRLLTQSPPHYPCYETSGTASEEVLPVTEQAFTVSANPFSSQTVVQFSSPGELEVYDQAGRLVGSASVDYQFILSGMDLAPGIYLLRGVTSQAHAQVVRVVKLS